MRVQLPFGRTRADDLNRPLAVQNARVLVIAGRKPVGENECSDTPLVVTLGDIQTFEAIQEHDVAAAGGDDYGTAVSLSRGGKRNGQERVVERSVALRHGYFALIPERDVIVAGLILFGRGFYFPGEQCAGK